jgi:hypothetical protein
MGEEEEWMAQILLAIPQVSNAKQEWYVDV